MAWPQVISACFPNVYVLGDCVAPLTALCHRHLTKFRCVPSCSPPQQTDLQLLRGNRGVVSSPRRLLPKHVRARRLCCPANCLLQPLTSHDSLSANLLSSTANQAVASSGRSWRGLKPSTSPSQTCTCSVTVMLRKLPWTITSSPRCVVCQLAFVHSEPSCGFFGAIVARPEAIDV